MKVLYVMQRVEHIHYHASTIKHLCDRGHQVIGLFDEQWSKSKVSEAVLRLKKENSRFSLNWLRRRDDRWRRPLFQLREVLNYGQYLHMHGQSDYYRERWLKYTSTRFQNLINRKFSRRIVHALLGSPLIYRILRGLEKRVPPDKSIVHCVAAYGPDIIVASPCNIRYSEEIEYIKAGLSMGIPTVIPVLSWDNLTTKGVYQVLPDAVLAWNAAHRQEAMQHHDVPPSRVIVTGAPVFDYWRDIRSPAPDYAAFCAMVGLDPTQPLILYLGSSANISGDESWLVCSLIAALRASPGAGINRANIMVRPHPANAKCYRGLSAQGVIVWPPNGILPDTSEGAVDFYNALHHAFAVVAVNTSGMIDAIINDKPVIAIMPETYRKTQEYAMHFRQLQEAGALSLCASSEAVVDTIRNIHEGNDPTRNARKSFVSAYVRPRGEDVPAGLIAALAMESIASREPIEEIDAHIESYRKSVADRCAGSTERLSPISHSSLSL